MVLPQTIIPMWDKHTVSREILARNKDFATSILKPEPTYLGDVIPVSGDGDLTNDGDMEPVLS